MKGEVQYLPLYINSQVVSAEPNFSKETKRATPEKTEEKRCNALLLTVWVWGLNVRSNCSQQPFKPNLGRVQTTGKCLLCLTLWKLREGRKESRKVWSEWAEVTGLQGVREDAGSWSEQQALVWLQEAGHRKHSGEITLMPVRVSEITDEGQNANTQRNSKETLSVLWMLSTASTLVKTVIWWAPQKDQKYSMEIYLTLTKNEFPGWTPLIKMQ